MPSNDSKYTATDTITYTYETGTDKLISYNGESITYDSILNPTTYRGKTLTLEQGRRLATLTDGNDTISYTYNADGIRTRKTVNGVTTEYIIVEGVLAGIKGSNYNVFFHYDESGRATGLTGYASGVTVNYYYEYNAQGDVVAMYDHAGNLTCTYEYDSWGKLLSVKDANGAEITNATSVAYLNPIRYRGYVYDDETGLYYVGSRYFDPEVGRWINADAFVSTGQGILGYNMFVYCGNNSVNASVPTGFITFWDVTDFIFAGRSWGEFISEPSWGRFGSAALDTIGLLPIIPFIGGIKRGINAVDSGIDATDSYKVITEGLCFVEGTLVHTESGLGNIGS